MLNKFLNEFLQQLSRKHLVKSELLRTNPVISDSIVWPIIAPNFIAQITTSHLLLAFSLVVSKRRSMKSRIELVPQIFKRFHFVSSLVARILTLCHYATRYMYGSTR